MERRLIYFLVLAGLSATALSNPNSRFQADKFLDMLARTFDEKVAYLDLLHALQTRLNLDPVSNATGTGSPSSSAPGGSTATTTALSCPEADYHAGATITYTSNDRSEGTRAFYECNKGYQGRSLFIQCMSGGMWSPILAWGGCKPVNCGPPPHVTNADASLGPSSYGAVITYTCRHGFKMDTPKANVTCLDSGHWNSPTFKCDKVITTPPPPANNAMNMAAMAALMSSMSGGEGKLPAGAGNPMMAMLKGMPGMAGLSGGFPMMGGPAGGQSSGSNNIMDMMKMLTGGFQPTPPPTTTTPAPPKQNAFPSSFGPQGGFQLPSHLRNLLPNGLSNAQGFKPQDLIALTSAGLGSGTPGGAGPRDITSLLSSMNPMSMLTPGMSVSGPGGRGRQPVDPEKMAEQREEMMMRAMMATAMKSMMGGGQRQGNGTNNANNGGMNNMMAMMALQNGLGGAGGSGGSGLDAMLPMMMGGGMGGMMGGMGGAGGGLFSGLFGGA